MKPSAARLIDCFMTTIPLKNFTMLFSDRIIRLFPCLGVTAGVRLVQRLIPDIRKEIYVIILIIKPERPGMSSCIYGSEIADLPISCQSLSHLICRDRDDIR